MISVALSREEGKTSVGAAALATGGGFGVVKELAAAVTGAVEAKRTLAALCIKGVVFHNKFLVYILEEYAPFLERTGLDRIEAFCASEEHWRSQQQKRLFGHRVAHV